MSADVHDLAGDKTMNATSCVRLANDDVWSVRSTGGASSLLGDNGASETAYRRPMLLAPMSPRKGCQPALTSTLVQQAS